MKLVNEPHLGAAHPGAFGIAQPRAIGAIDDDMAPVGGLQQAGDVQ